MAISSTLPASSVGGVVFTGVSLLMIGSALKIAEMCSEFIIKTSLQTGASYLTGRLVVSLLDAVLPDSFGKTTKVLTANVAMLLFSTSFFPMPIASKAAAMIVLNLQSCFMDPYLGLSSVFGWAK